jgi:hypothetical protein
MNLIKNKRYTSDNSDLYITILSKVYTDVEKGYTKAKISIARKKGVLAHVTIEKPRYYKLFHKNIRHWKEY